MANILLRSTVAAGLLLALGQSHAITITPSTSGNTLVNALLAGGNTGIVVTSATLNGHSDLLTVGDEQITVYSSGTYSNGTGTYSIGPGVVLSTGAVNAVPSADPQEALPGYGDGPWPGSDSIFDISNPTVGGTGTTYAYSVEASGAQELLLDPITQNPSPSCSGPNFCDHFDVTELIINFDMQPGFTEVRFNVVFGSEEWPEFRDSQYVDGFGMFLNNTNIAFVGGLPVNVKHPSTRPTVTGMQLTLTGTEPDAITGTALDGILAPGGNPLLTFSGTVNPTGNQLRFIVADTSDALLDTTVYFSALTGVPAPAAVWLLGSGLLGLASRRVMPRTRN